MCIVYYNKNIDASVLNRSLKYSVGHLYILYLKVYTSNFIFVYASSPSFYIILSDVCVSF